MEILVFLFLMGLIFGAVGAAIASNKNVDGLAGFLLGAFLGPIGLIIVALLNPTRAAASSAANGDSRKEHDVDFGGERSFTSDAYRLWLADRYQLHRNVFDRFVIDDHTFETLDAALAYCYEMEAAKAESSKLDQERIVAEQERNAADKAARAADRAELDRQNTAKVIYIWLFFLALFIGFIFFSGLFLGDESPKSDVGTKSDEFPIDYGSMQDFKISFPIKILKNSDGIDLDTTMQVELETLSSDMCNGIDGCSFVKRRTIHVNEAGNFLTGYVDEANERMTYYFRSDGSSIKSVDSSSGVTCLTLKSAGVRGKVGSTFQTDEKNCSDGNSSNGIVKVFYYDQDLVEVTSEYEYDGDQNRNTMLLDREGNLKGFAFFQMKLGYVVHGQSYNVKNPRVNF